MPVLCYHSVHPDWEASLSVRPEHFADQCRWMSRTRTVLPALRFAEAHVSGRLRRRTVAITFDDGFADFQQHAIPLLRTLGLPVTMFVVARTLQEAQGGATWLRPKAEVPPATLTVDQVLELQESGVDFGSHSWAHHDLRQLGEAECLRDLRESRELLADILGREVPLLAYPYGLHDSHVRRAAEKAGYRFAFTLPEGPEPQGAHAVPRAGVYRGNSLMALRFKATKWYLRARMSPHAPRRDRGGP